MTKPRPIYRIVMEIDTEIERLTSRLRELQERRRQLVPLPQKRPEYYKRKERAA